MDRYYPRIYIRHDRQKKEKMFIRELILNLYDPGRCSFWLLFLIIFVACRIIPAIISFFLRESWGSPMEFFQIVWNWISTKSSDRHLKVFRVMEDVVLLIIYVFNVSSGIVLFVTDSNLVDWYKSNGWSPGRYMEDNDTREIMSFCMWQLQFYFVLLILVCIHPRKRDWKLMATHHLSTLFLLGTGLWYSYLAGSVVALIVHDICDIFLQLSTLSNKLNLRLRTPFFLTFTILHVILRVIFFPFIVYSTVIYSPGEWDWIPDHTWSPVVLCVPIWVMHVYWTKACIDVIRKHIGNPLGAIDPRENNNNNNKNNKNNNKKQ